MTRSVAEAGDPDFIWDGLEHVRRILEKAAKADCAVLITGENGTGKEISARFLHTHGRRSDGPFVACNCAAIPKDLVESELFGHLKGAFTSSVQDKAGLFQQADGGSLFFDEIAEAPLDVQVKLLRALEDKRIRPVGATAEEPVDVRILAATNQEIPRVLESGKFRRDLYYRLAVVEIALPPLRERREAIAPLTAFFLGTLSRKMERSVPTVSAGARELLLRHSYPGNVRELRNRLEHALVMLGSGLEILPEHLPRELRRAAGKAPLRPSDGPLGRALLEVAESLPGFDQLDFLDRSVVLPLAEIMVQYLQDLREPDAFGSASGPNLLRKLHVPPDLPYFKALTYSLATAIRWDLAESGVDMSRINTATLRSRYGGSLVKADSQRSSLNRKVAELVLDQVGR